MADEPIEDKDKDGIESDKSESDDEAGSQDREKRLDAEGPVKKLKQDMDEGEEDDFEISENNFKLNLAEYGHLLAEKDDSVLVPVGGDLWKKYENELRDQAYTLSEELRSVLMPTKIAGLKGDFKTGKRLNMRKVISFVASNYRKDKIWLRRSDPSQRDYQILLAIDDTSSMSEANVGLLALQSLTVLALS